MLTGSMSYCSPLHPPPLTYNRRCGVRCWLARFASCWTAAWLNVTTDLRIRLLDALSLYRIRVFDINVASLVTQWRLTGERKSKVALSRLGRMWHENRRMTKKAMIRCDDENACNQFTLQNEDYVGRSNQRFRMRFPALESREALFKLVSTLFGRFMLPKRRFWKEEQKMKCGFSKEALFNGPWPM